jgi:hypothetical protein
MVHAMGLTRLHPDFSDSDADGYGIPFNVVDSTTARSNVSFDYDDESDIGPYPIPANPAQEAGGDAHVLLLERDQCRLYELYAARYDADEGWRAGSGAIFDLTSNALRPASWTSADAAGLPIFPGLARYDEASASSGIDHALRVTVPTTQRAYLWPARHYASSSRAPWNAPMGLRVRIKASYSIAAYPAQARAVLTAVKRYGLIVADNGSAGFVSGAPDPGWDDDALHTLHNVPASAFEVVDTSSLPGAPTTRSKWNPRYDHPHRGYTRVRFFNSRRGPCRLQAVRGGHVVRTRRSSRCRQGLVSLTMRSARHAHYRVRLV